MPVDYTNYAERALVVSTVTGDVSPEEMFAHQTMLGADPLFSSRVVGVTDFLETLPFSGSSDDVRRRPTPCPGQPFRRRCNARACCLDRSAPCGRRGV